MILSPGTMKRFFVIASSMVGRSFLQEVI